MPSTTGAPGSMRFGVFEADLCAGELRKRGLKIKIQEQPFQILAALLERPGEIVAREELQARLWPGDTFVQFHHSLTVAMNRLRKALDDSADNPIFIETLPRRGYRFIAPVERIDCSNVTGEPVDAIQMDNAGEAAKHSANSWSLPRVAVCLVAAAVGSAVYLIHSKLTPPGGYHPAPSKLMLAVLPFRNLSGDPKQDYVSDGMTEELVAHLGQLDPRDLGVIARTSVMKYKNSSADVKQIGQELGVRYVLEGSVRRTKTLVDVKAELVQTSDQTQLWAETYERPLAGIGDIERDAALRIAKALALNLLPARQAALARAETTKAVAYESYLGGVSVSNEGTEAGFHQALVFFQRAVEQDPHYAMAYAGLAQVYLSLGDYHFITPTEADVKADRAVSQALTADPSIPALYLLRAALLSRKKPTQQDAEQAYQYALELNPSYAQAHVDYALYLRAASRYPEAQQQVDQALVLDPLSPNVNVVAAWISMSAGQIDEAVARLQRALQLNPKYPAALYFLGRINERRGRPEDAISYYQKAVSASGRGPKYLHALGMALAKLGRYQDARKVLEEMGNQAKCRYVDPEYLTSLQALLKG